MSPTRREITGFSNPTVKALRALREKSHRKSAGHSLAAALRLLTDARALSHLPEVRVRSDRHEHDPPRAALD